MFLRVVLAIVLVLSASCLPYKQKIALLNSLQVGRDEEPMVWECTGCDQATKPIRSHIIEQSSKDVKAILSVYQEFTVLAFRYTATALNLWQDILYISQVQDQHAPSGCKVQKEYDNMWNSIIDDTMDDLERSSHTGHLIITGISLGGGLAALSYVDIEKSGIYDQIEVINFGSPRVGNEKWANWINSKIMIERFYIKNDPIAIMPNCLTKLICNYKQIGIPYRCDKNKEECQRLSVEEENEIEFGQIASNLKKEVEEHAQDGDVGGLIDHIFGYKLLSTYTMIE